MQEIKLCTEEMLVNSINPDELLIKYEFQLFLTDYTSYLHYQI